MAKRYSVMFMLAGMCILVSSAARADWTDNFESYTPGNVDGQGPWVDFGGSLTGDVSIAQFKSGAQSLALSLNPAANNSYGSDVYLGALNNGAAVTSGSWTVSYELFFPTDYLGGAHMYFSQTPMISFRDGVWLHGRGGDGTLRYGVDGDDSIALVYDAWAQVKLAIDLDADTVTASYNGTPFHTGVWDMNGDPETLTPGIGGINFWADGSGAVGLEGTFYVDDLSLTPEPATMSLLALGGLAVLRRRRRQ